MPRVPGQRVFQSEETCPYWVLHPRTRMATVIYGCGGYGEVAPRHPAASAWELPDGARLCKRCHGTGRMDCLNGGMVQS